MDAQLTELNTMELDDVRNQLISLKENGMEPERFKSTIERVLRTKALTLGTSNAQIEEVNAYIEIVISLAKEEICPKTLTIQILQDIFDVSTTARCEQLFTIVESHIATWKTPFFDSCKNMILRMCNDLLKRLSRTIDTTFCGRILILLAKSLPLTEKSGLNLTGQFNTLNITTYELEMKQLDDGLQSAQPDDDMEIGEIRETKDATGTIPTDHSLYVKFWELQKFFSNPNALFEAEHFKQFEKDISDIFSIFSAYKIEKPQKKQQNLLSKSQDALATNKRLDERSMADCNDATKLNGYTKIEVDMESPKLNGYSPSDKSNLLTSEQTFFAKYLTSQKLFPLQLADSQFRRYFLVQFLVVSNYLTSKVRLKDPAELTSAQEVIMRDLTDKCYTLLRETYPHGSHFVDSIKKTLTREKQWALWKGENCPDIITPLINSKERKCSTFKRKQMARYDPKVLDLGNKELTRLWNIEKDNLQACSSVSRKCIPDLKKFLEEALDEMDPEQQVEERYQSANNEQYQWMASRFLLLNSDQYITFAVQDPGTRAVEKEFQNGAYLKKAIQQTSENIPELKPRVDQIQSRLELEQKVKKELAARQAEEARLAAKTKELEKRIKQEEEEQQVASQIKKEEPMNGHTATTSDAKKEDKKEVPAENDVHKQQNSSPPTRKPQRMAQPESNDKEEAPPPKKRTRQQHEDDNSSNSSHSVRKKDKETPTPERDPQQHSRSGTASRKEKKDDKERKSAADDGDKDRKVRKRHLEEERKTTSNNSVSTSRSTERKENSSTTKSSTDREHRSENDRAKKRK